MMTKSINVKEEEEYQREEEHLTTVKHILQDAKMLFIGLHDNGGRQFQQILSFFFACTADVFIHLQSNYFM